jgi:hypothetical protein
MVANREQRDRGRFSKVAFKKSSREPLKPPSPIRENYTSSVDLFGIDSNPVSSSVEPIANQETVALSFPITSSIDGNKTQGISNKSTDVVLGDRERTERRYMESIKRLDEALTLRKMNWEAFHVSDLHFTDSESLPKLQLEIEKMLNTWKSPVTDQTHWSKITNMMGRMFTAISPFSKHFLTVAINAQQVFFYSTPLFNSGLDAGI